MFWTLSWILIIGGALLLAGSAIYRAYEEEKEQYKGKTTGTVIEIQADTPNQAGRAAGIHDFYYPVIAYYADGLFYKVRYHKGANPCPLEVKQKVEIRYDVADPYCFRIAVRSRCYKMAMLAYHLGMGCCIAGAVIFLLFAMGILKRI